VLTTGALPDAAAATRLLLATATAAPALDGAIPKAEPGPLSELAVLAAGAS